MLRHLVPKTVTVACLSAVLLIGCSPFGLVDDTDTPTEALDPKAVKSQAGVLALYRSSLLSLSQVVAGGRKSATGKDDGNIRSFVRLSGHISDELDYRTVTSGLTPTYSLLEISTRNFDPDPSGNVANLFFDRLNELRILAAATQAGFRSYGSQLSDTILAHAMTIEASSLIMLAELYCSGVPLSTLNSNGDFTLTRGYSTQELYVLALNMLDSAAVHSSESSRISGLIALLRVRILLGQGNVQQAAASAGDIETAFHYDITYSKAVLSSDDFYGKFTVASTPKTSNIDHGERIGNLKGSNGLPYTTSDDPRSQLPALQDPWAPLVLTSGVEARLAEAEAALERGDDRWLVILNALRTSCVPGDVCAVPEPAGSGGVAGLGLLSDPGTAPGRLDLLFSERAYWLFLRGFRQGDLRRRIRTYGARVDQIYPIGFPEVGNVAYGDQVSIPVPLQEQRYNPNYRGCLNNDA